MSKIVAKFANFQLQARMFFELFIRLLVVLFLFQLAVIILYNYWFNHSVWLQSYHLLFSGLWLFFDLVLSFELDSASSILDKTFSLFWDLEKSIILGSCWLWLLFPVALIYVWFWTGKSDEEVEYIRGARAILPSELNRATHKISSLDLLWPLRLKNSIPFGQVKLPVSEENKQTFIVGKPGSGKTNAFNQIIEKVRARKQKCIIHDYKGDYVEKFYNPDDGILFNPLDTRSLGWCLFNDCKSVMDIEGFAGALIPEAVPGTDPFWNNAARDVMVGILRYCYANGKTTNRDIWETSILPNDHLYNLLRRTIGGERGAKHIEDTSSKTAASIMSNLMQYVKVFEYMAPMQGNFSITSWVEDKNSSGMIFITNYAKLQHTLNPIISLFIQTVGNVLLSQTDDLNNRLFFFLDEFGQLQNMATIQNLMTASRSKDGAVFIGVQDIGQIDKIYKKETRTSILNSASNRIIFNCKDHDTAKFFSCDIGEIEYWEAMESQSLAMNSQDRISTSKQRRKEFLVSPEDIQALANLEAIVSIGHQSIALSKFKYKPYAKLSAAFIQRLELDLEHIVDITPFSIQNCESKELTSRFIAEQEFDGRIY